MMQQRVDELEAQLAGVQRRVDEVAAAVTALQVAVATLTRRQYAAPLPPSEAGGA